DINECVTNAHNCDANAFCNNTQGFYNCTCSPGYTGNGTSCNGSFVYKTSHVLLLAAGGGGGASNGYNGVDETGM
ncbi:unnamed protein product, partial [Porites lobata]